MISTITTPEEVREFARQLIAEGTSIHPDDNFHGIISAATGLPAYTHEEAEQRNALMDQCFDVCEAEGLDIYEVMLEILQQEAATQQA